MSIAAVILAGGRGERLGGVNKALIEIGGERFIDRAMRAASGCAPILAAVGRTPFELPDPASAVLDIESDYAGPLAGVAAAAEALAVGGSEALLSLAVDGPLFPTDFVERATALLAHAPAVIAAYRGQVYPTNGLWRMEALARLPAGVRDGSAPRSLKRLAEAMGAVVLDYAELSGHNPFRNANTPEELAFLRAQIAVSKPG